MGFTKYKKKDLPPGGLFKWIIDNGQLKIKDVIARLAEPWQFSCAYILIIVGVDAHIDPRADVGIRPYNLLFKAFRRFYPRNAGR